MRPTYLLVLPAICSLVSCSRSDLSYAPPSQRKLLPVASLVPHAPMAEMSESSVLRNIVKDIDPSDGPSDWRWTGQQPTVKVHIRGNEAFKFYAEFAIADATFKDTGPLSIAFKVNDQILKTVRYDRPGNKTFEAPVPPSFLRPEADNIIAAELDKIWVAPQDGARLGVILTKMGLRQR